MAQGGKTRKSGVARPVTHPELEAALNTVLAPIHCAINTLNDTVAALVQSWNQEHAKRALLDSNPSSVASDILGSTVHRVSKNVSSLKEQFSSYRQNIIRINDKMESLERLLDTLVKRQTKRLADTPAMQILQHFDEYLANLNKKQKLEVSYESTNQEGELSHLVMYTSGEDEYPNGSWLGDSNQPDARVRCCIQPNDLLYINAKCTTPEKMALTLLDYLFSKDTLAVSNLSGKSKLGKKQLDPVLIHGVKCHLVHIFNITENHWERIKLNIDSKCRTAWKKRQAAPETEYCEQYPEESHYNESQSYGFTGMEDEGGEQLKKTGLVIRKQQSRDFEMDDDNSKLTARVFRTVQGGRSIEVLATDQVVHFQDLHNVHVLHGDHILPIIHSDADDGEERENIKAELELVKAEDVELYSTDTVSFVEPIMEEGPDSDT